MLIPSPPHSENGVSLSTVSGLYRSFPVTMSVGVDSSFGSFSMQSMMDLSDNVSTRGVSRRGSRHGSFSVRPSSPLLETIEGLGQGKEEKISVLDPRRFTPTLHASLVSEILALRREVETKNSLVLDLEESLFSVKGENTKLHDIVADGTKQNRSLRNQMKTLEGETLSAIENLARERDMASQALSDVRKRLDVFQKKVRNQEEDAEKTHVLWDNDKQRWEMEKRNLDRKVHIVEGRLKTLLSEMEASQSSNVHPRDGSLNRASGTRSAASRHRDSITTTDGTEPRNVRLSNIEESAQNTPGTTLADELEFDDDEFYDHVEDGHASPEALAEESLRRSRPFSAQSHQSSIKARRVLGLAVEDSDEQFRDSPRGRSSIATETSVDYMDKMVAEYVDNLTQDSSPPSPSLPSLQTLATIDEAEGGSFLEEPTAGQMGQDEANTATLDTKQISNAVQNSTTMVSSASQTIEQPLSPPGTPVDREECFPLSHFPKPVEMSSSSTQTSDEEIPSLPRPAAFRGNNFLSTEIPVIAIRPPSSGSPQGGVVLPPHTRNASCQAAISTSHRSISVQTEEIRIDQRSFKLPPHLLPSAISSNPPSPLTGAPASKPLEIANRESLPRIVPPLPVKSSRRSIIDTEKTDVALLTAESDEERIQESDFDEDIGNLSDDSFVSKEPVRKVLSKVQNSWKLVPQPDELPKIDRLERANLLFNDTKSRKVSDIKERPYARSVSPTGTTTSTSPKSSSGKQDDIRRKALISSGTAAHFQQPRSPSLPILSSSEQPASAPPFPVPDRSSSKNIPWNRRDEDGSPTRGTATVLGKSKWKDQGRPPAKKPVLRKIRSASSTTYTESLSGRRSPPLRTPLPDRFDEGPLSFHPPLPNDVVSSPYGQSSRQISGSRHSNSAVSASGSAASDQTSVVDAIAQTMIGEWMWKYVRRRKSFGLPESAATEFENGRNEVSTSGGVRHQRWVWLAPYERAVMWSGKQPMTGSALMGKNGRKCKSALFGQSNVTDCFLVAIQSVLDVRDDAVMPKGAVSSSCFGRSILILTPHRALKFTATTRERHYVWLTALSFLSHSNTVPRELGNLAPATPQEKTPPPSRRSQAPSVKVPGPQTATLRRHYIKDSIRIAKGKDRPILGNGGRRSQTSPGMSIRPPLPPPIPRIYDRLVEDIEEAAEAPLVPRTTSDIRKRSNTGPKSSRPSSAYRNYLDSAKPSVRSLQSMNESENSHNWMADGGPNGGVSSRGRRGQDWNASSQSREGSGNFFEAVGTMRMEAFVNETAKVYGVGGASGNSHMKVKEAVTELESRSRGKINGMVDGGKGGPGTKVKGLMKRDIKYWGGGSDKVPPTGRLGAGGSDPFDGF